MVSGGYTPKTEADTLKSIQRDSDKLWGRRTNTVGLGVSTGGSGGGGSGDVSPAPLGNFLPLSGGTLTGSLAFNPIIAQVNEDNEIDISNEGNSTSRVFVATRPGRPLKTIIGARNAGQLLLVQGIRTIGLTIQHTLDDPDEGNIRTINGNDITIESDNNILLVFDSTSNSWRQITPILSDFTTAMGTNFNLHDGGTVGDLTLSIDANVPMGNNGYVYTLDGDIGISLANADTGGHDFYVVLEQDSTGGHAITAIDSKIVTPIPDLDNVTILRFVGYNGTWTITKTGSIGGGGTGTEFLADIGDVQDSTPTNGSLLGRENNEWAPVKLADAYITDNTIGVAKISGTGQTEGSIPRVNASGTVEWSTATANVLKLANIGDVEDSTPTNGSLLGRVNNEWAPVKLADAYITDNTISGAKLTNETLTVGKINATGQAEGRVIQVDGDGNAIWSTATSNIANLANIGDVVDATPTNGTLLGRADNEWGATKLNDNHINDNSISGGKIQTDSTPLGKLSVTGSSTDNLIVRTATGVEWQTFNLGNVADVVSATPVNDTVLVRINNEWQAQKVENRYIKDLGISGNKITNQTMSVNKINTQSEAEGKTIVIGENNMAIWAVPDTTVALLGNIGDVASATPTPNTILARIGTQWEASKLNDNFITNSTISGGKISNDSLAVGKINATGQTEGSVIRVDNTGNAVWSSSTSNIATLANIGDVEDGTPTNGTLLARADNEWGASKLNNDHITNSTISGEKLTNNSIAIAKISTTDSSVGQVLARGSSGIDWVNPNLADLGDVTDTTPVNNTILVREDNEWQASKLMNVHINDDTIDVDKLSDAGASNGDVLTRVSSNNIDWKAPPDATVSLLGNIGDVASQTPLADTVLVRSRDGTQWESGKVGNEHINNDSISPQKINDLGASNGYVLTRIGSNNINWRAIPSQTATIDELADIGDVANQSPANNTVLVRNGSTWQAEKVSNDIINNDTISVSKLSDSGASNGDVLTRVGTNNISWEAPSGGGGGGISDTVNNLEINGALNHDGNTLGFFDTTPVRKSFVLDVSTSASLSLLISSYNTLLGTLRNYGLI